MSVAIKSLSAAGAAALTVGVLTLPAGSAAQGPRHGHAGHGRPSAHVPVLQKPTKRFKRAIERGHRRAQRIEAAHDKRSASQAPDGAVSTGAASDSAGGFPSPESVGVSSATLQAIAACESGGDATAVSADGTYHGLYQFDYGTWASVGGSGDPAAASPAEQTYRAALLYAQSGSNPWPICGS